MSIVKAHIVFDDEQIEQPEGREKILGEIKKATKIANVNQERFERYGILTAMVEESSLDKVRKIPGVAGVEIDQERELQK